MFHTGSVSDHSHRAALLLPGGVHVDADGGSGLVHRSRARLRQETDCVHYCLHTGQLWHTCPLHFMPDSTIRPGSH